MKLTGMTAQDAIQLLEPALTKDEAGRYRLGCRKASLMVKLHGRSAPLRFGLRNELGFRAEERGCRSRTSTQVSSASDLPGRGARDGLGCSVPRLAVLDDKVNQENDEWSFACTMLLYALA